MRLQIHVGALHGLGDCGGVSSGGQRQWRAAEMGSSTQGPTSDHPTASEEGPEVAQVSCAQDTYSTWQLWGWCAHIHRACKGTLRRNRAQRSPVPHDPCQMGPRQLQPDNFCRPQERLWGVQAEAARGSGLFSGFGEGSRVGVPQGSCSLRPTLPIPALT